ncbi:MAG TPA: PQQ-binding-like beta-propeller repeat protein [Dongiaceae bacterium]|nr:PQQ-binding-like beta-propeller repeat protein [Dongiaceae bacterium]
MRRWVLLLLAAAALSGCATAKSWLGFGTYQKPLPGKRISVLQLNSSLAADPALADVKVELPQPFANPDWPQPGGYANHAMYHLQLGDSLSVAWKANIGTEADSDLRILSEPVVGDGRVYTIDAESRVSAFNADTGAELWRVDVAKDVDSDKLLGGGVAYDKGRVFVATSFAQVVALDAASGKEIWRRDVSGPMRAGPTIADGRVFVVTIDNSLFALAEDDGRRLWTHSGLNETAGLLGTASPAVAGNDIVVVYSSGEIYGLRVDTGRTLWSDNLAGQIRTGAVATLADIRGRPFIDRDIAVAISNSGTMAAIDMRTGARVWDANFGGSQAPWVGGDYIFVLTNDQELLCLTRQQGHVRWVTSLPKYVDPQDPTEPILWHGPVLSGNRLILTGTDAKALAVSPYTGKILGQIDLPGPTHLPPVVAKGTLYILSDTADLIALR